METKADLLIPYGYTEEAMKFYQKIYDKDSNNNQKYYSKRDIFKT